jgi:hypothetical protein
LDDREIARRSLDLQQRGRDFPFVTIPVYVAWSKRKLQEGESEALINHMDAMAHFCRPEEVAELTEDVFEEILDDIRREVDG